MQEAVTNVLNHAAARSVVITLDWQPDRLVLTVTDDGIPVDRSADSGGGRGLLGLAERVSLYGGSLRHGPATPHGYQVRAELPLVDALDRAAP